MILAQLFMTFFRIGLVSFGGGYAMIPVIGEEISKRGWLMPGEFYDLIAVSEVTPGSVSINTATFVGYRVSGFLGGLAATVGLVLPSLVVVLAAALFLIRKKDARPIRYAFSWVKPAIAGLIIAAGAFVAKTCLVNAGTFSLAHPAALLNYKGIAMFLFSDFSIRKLKMRVFPLIGLCSIVGIVLFYGA